MYMRPILFIAFIAMFSLNVNAQISTPEKGTVWIYEYTNVSICGPIQAIYERDTVLAGKSAMVFNETLYNICNHPNDDKLIDTINWGSNIIAIEDSLVWY